MSPSSLFVFFAFFLPLFRFILNGEFLLCFLIGIEKEENGRGGNVSFLFKLYVLYYDRQKVLQRINIMEEGEFLFFLFISRGIN